MRVSTKKGFKNMFEFLFLRSAFGVVASTKKNSKTWIFTIEADNIKKLLKFAHF